VLGRAVRSEDDQRLARELVAKAATGGRS
jgi:hypothetical protein